MKTETKNRLVAALTELRAACKAVPEMNHHKYDALGARVNDALNCAAIDETEESHRIDWLQTHLDAIKIDCNLAFDKPFVITFTRGVVGYNKRAGFSGATLRETIDQAISGRQLFAVKG